jgi:hypothetical protein
VILADVNLDGGSHHPQRVTVAQCLFPVQYAIVQSGAVKALQVPNVDQSVPNRQDAMVSADQGVFEPEVAITATTDEERGPVNDNFSGLAFTNV